jgi:uncharacterized paraquat-inducible protein A
VPPEFDDDDEIADKEYPNEADTHLAEDDVSDPCPHCGRSVYHDAAVCPYCGEMISSFDGAPRKKGPIAIAFVLLLLFLLTWLLTRSM